MLRLYIRTLNGLTSNAWQLFARLLPGNESIDSKFEALRSGKLKQQTTIDEIYKLLNILDSKASALMRYNGIILAVITFSTHAGQPFSKLVYAIVFLTLASIFSCLMVVGVFWNLLSYIEPAKFTDDAAPIEGSGDLTKEANSLRKLLLLRETAYQTAWWSALLVSLLLAVYFIRNWDPWTLPS
ncbi:hypothetical protein [Rhodoplanes azumiensis]|uniref:Uncharacterized protein n=1 Tax=Rhodoplanes azumiensis TaxID=1897628 RepID=A0ABW5ALF4_9BRAD